MAWAENSIGAIHEKLGNYYPKASGSYLIIARMIIVRVFLLLPATAWLIYIKNKFWVVPIILSAVFSGLELYLKDC